MSELNLSLYHLAEGGDLLELFEMRAEAERCIADAKQEDVESRDAAIDDLVVLDKQIELYMAALPAKVDSVRHVWKRIEVLIQEAADEVKFQSRRGQHLKADLECLKDYCQRCMELIEWKPGKPRKLEGRSGYLLLKGNGGRPAVEVYDERLIPDELTTKTITLSPLVWQEILNAVCDAPRPTADRVMALMRDGVKESARLPSLSLISARLSEACQRCGGSGLVPIVDDNAEHDTCSECGGSGKASVPGARLKEPGSHVECK